MDKLLTVRRGAIEGETIYFALEICCNCYMPFMMPKYLKEQALADHSIWFCCPAGHNQHYSGPTEAQKLKTRLENERREHEKQLQESTNRFLDEVNTRKRFEKQLKRVHKGVCPCCNRSFVNLANHMKTRHPEIAPSAVSNELQMKITKKV